MIISSGKFGHHRKVVFIQKEGFELSFPTL